MAAKILVVDDESDVQLIIRTALEVEGFDVVTACDGEEGLERAKEELPDLIVLDVMMPKKDGFAVLAGLKEDDETCEIPVIMLTGLSDRDRIQKALMSGSDFYIVKPFEIDDLLQKVRIALR